MNKDAINHAIEAAFIADAYALGAHWIYDEKKLKSLDINWQELNAPQAMWHKGKVKGDFTHYGDQGKWLEEFIKKNSRFEISKYREYWLQKMRTYKGYIDASSRETLEALNKDPQTDKGSNSRELSIIGRIAPLLLVSSSKEAFLDLVEDFVSFTHNSEITLKAANFFASVLYDVLEGASIEDALHRTKVDPMLQKAYDDAVKSKAKESFSTIRNFGPACGVEGGFESVIHLLLSYDDYKEAMMSNAKAGGDSAARGMIVGMIMGAAGKEIPLSWKKGAKNL